MLSVGEENNFMWEPLFICDGYVVQFLGVLVEFATYLKFFENADIELEMMEVI